MHAWRPPEENSSDLQEGFERSEDFVPSFRDVLPFPIKDETSEEVGKIPPRVV